MKKIYQKFLSLGIALTLVVGAFTGCTDKGTTSNDTTNQSGTASPSGTAPSKDEATAYMNATGFPIAKEKITLKLMGKKLPLHGDWKDMEIFKRMEKLTNISFDFDTPLDTGYLEKKNLAFASGNYPEVFYQGGITVQDEETYGPQGVLIPLEDYIEKYAPTIKKVLDSDPSIRKSITASDGHIYSLPYIIKTKTMASGILYMNTDWLKNVGMSMPSTVDEFYDVLKAFKTKDPNKNNKQDEIPLSFWKQNSAGAGDISNDLLSYLYPAFSGQAGGANFDIKDGKVIFNPAEPTFKDYLAYMRKLYSEKLIDNEMFTQTLEQYVAKYKEGTMGISSLSLSVVLTPGAPANYELIPPLTSSTNSKKVTAEFPYVNTGVFALTNKCKYPEAMVRWADTFFRTVDENVEGICGLSNWLGIYEDTWKFADADRKTFSLESKVEGITPSEYINKYIMPGGFGWVVADAIPAGNPFLLLKATESDKHYFPYMIPKYPSTARFTQQQAERMNFLRNDINTYVEQMIAKFITGNESLDKWDNYVSTLNSMGLEELTKIMQEGYDKWNKK